MHLMVYLDICLASLSDYNLTLGMLLGANFLRYHLKDGEINLRFMSIFATGLTAN